MFHCLKLAKSLVVKINTNIIIGKKEINKYKYC